VRDQDTDAAFEIFYKAHKNSLQRYVAVLNRNGTNTEDIVQEVMIIIRRYWGRYERPEVLIYQIARQELRRQSRRLPQRTVPLDENLAEADEAMHRKAGANPLEAVEERDGLLRLLRDLSVRQREVVVLLDIVGLCTEQASAVLGISPSAVKTHHGRALARLAELDTARLAGAQGGPGSQKEGIAR
jgi:RNA polymerase sigma factor (sigma-70 family)